MRTSKKDFQDGRRGDHLGFLIRTSLAIFDLQVTTLILSIKFRVNCPFGSVEDIQNWFSRWPLIKTILSLFGLYFTPILSTTFRVDWLSIQKFKADFQDCARGGHLGFPIGMILTIYDLQDTPILPTKFKVHWPYASGKEAETDF